jgi:hypothetical protein
MVGLEKFTEVTLDFQGVDSIGQGFADEIFRVFTRMHPGVRVGYANAPPAIDAMIRHSVDNHAHEPG